MESSIQREWIETRNRQLVQWFAEGQTDEAILHLCDQAGYDLSMQGIADLRMSLHGEVVQLLATDGQKFLAKLPRTHKAVRVRELEDLCNRLRRGEQWCEDRNKWPTLPKLADVHMKALRLIAEEAQDIQPVAHGLEDLVGLVRRASPERRKQILVRVQELRSMIEVVTEIEPEPAEGPPILDMEPDTDA